MASQVLLGFVVLPAVLFALAYYPLLNLMSSSLAGPYARADVRKRLIAAAIDGLLSVTLWSFYFAGGAPAFGLAGAAYLLLRDAIGGRSVGKLIVGQVVIDLFSGRPCGVGASV